MPLENGRYITIDCVVRSFNYEEPYTEKKDTNMDLEYLNGVPDTRNYKTTDAQDFMSLASEQEALSELGKLFKRKSSGGGSGDSGDGKKKKGFARIKEIAKKGLHLTNILNPATATLRLGVLAAMKLNFMKIGAQIRYAYLTEEQAKQKGLIMDRYYKMRKIREKLDKIFYGAGGKPEALKKAILQGKGNKNKEVPLSGLGYSPYEDVDGLHEDMPLSQLLGNDIYESENISGIEGLGELGEPATAATIAAATTVLTTIAALIKKVGSLVPKKNAEKGGGGESGGGGGGGSEGGGDSSSGEENESSSEDSGGSDESTNGNTENLPAAKRSSTPATNNDSGGDDDDAGDNQQKSMTKTSGSGSTKPSFWDNNKKWIKPVGIGVGSLGLIALIYHLLKPKPKPKQALSGAPKKGKRTGNNLLNGIKSKAKKGGHHPAKKHKAKGKKKVVTLL